MFVTINYTRKAGKNRMIKKFNDMLMGYKEHFHTMGPEGENCHNGNCVIPTGSK